MAEALTPSATTSPTVAAATDDKAASAAIGQPTRRTGRSLARELLPIALVLGSGLFTMIRMYDVDVGFFLGDEGLSMLIAEEIVHGGVLFRDFAAYGPLWHYSLAATFAVFGVSFQVMRIFYLTLSTVAALLGYLTVARISGNRWLAVLAGVLIGLFPGTFQKTFIPLIQTASLYTLSR